MVLLAECLRRAGRVVTIADTTGADTPEELATRYRDCAEMNEGRSLTWVAHSNAGMYLPRVLRDRPGDIGIFVDASLPAESPPYVSASGARLQAVRSLAGAADFVPAWPDWWDTEQLQELLPDQEQRQALRRSCPRLPLSYFTAEIDVPRDWQLLHAGYLCFDGGYVGERDRMRSAGWPTAHVSLGHLGLLTGPDTVADAVRELEARLRVGNNR